MRTRLDTLVASALQQGSAVPAFTFVARTGAQLLAVAVGNVHGKYKGEPRLRWDVLQDIAVRTHIPLVLHGASGIPSEELVKAAAMNVGKVNFNTELRTGVLATLEERQPTVPTARTSRRCWGSGMPRPGTSRPLPWAR